MESEKLSPQHLKIISDVIDQVMEEYANANKIIFSSETERAKHHFGSVNKRLRDWKKSKECMVPRCTKQSINKSHTIPKGLSLSQISENGHLLTPQFDQQIGKIVMRSVGVSLASTFPGFCSEHERLFEDFETQKNIETEAHVYLQAYRAACREFFRTKFLLEQNDWLLSHYSRLRDTNLLEVVKKRAIDNGFPVEANFTSFSMKNDPLIEFANDRIRCVQELSAHIQNKLLPGLVNAVFNRKEDEVFIQAINLDIMIPVALSGCAAFHVNDHGTGRSINLIMNVIPSNGKSLIVFCGSILDKEFIEQYISIWCVNVFTLLSMIESWMVNGTDQWYIKPSVWEKIRGNRKSSILKDIYECKQNIGQEYRFSIFDAIREDMLAKLKEKEESTQDLNNWQFVKAQKAKIT